MKIEVISRGTAIIDADPDYQQPPIRSALLQVANEEAAPDFVASAIIDCTDSDRDISHDEYATVTEDDGTVLWAGWLDGSDRPAPDAVDASPGAPVYLATIVHLAAALRDIRDANPGAPAAAYACPRASVALGTIPPGIPAEPDAVQRLLALPLPDNDSGASTVGGYLAELLLKVWEKEEDFDGKRPFGNSGWQRNLTAMLGNAGALAVAEDDGKSVTERADALILGAIHAMGRQS